MTELWRRGILDFMFTTLWFLLKSLFIIALFAFVIHLGGTVSIALGSYTMSMTVGVFAVALFLILWCLSIITRFINMVVSAPQLLSDYNRQKAHKKGLQSLAFGLSAIAAGDVKAASYYTKRIVKYFKREDYGLSDLMTGLTARLEGDEAQVRRSFHTMMLHKETSFLGLKGLLQTAIDKRDYRYARILAEKAYAKHPDQPWIIKTLYDLELRTQNYEQAFALLKQADKKNVLNKEDIANEKALLLLGQGQIAKAHKFAPLSLPVGLKMLDEWSVENKRRKSVNLINKLWAKNPHPDLMDYWIKYAPKKTIDNMPAMAVWVEELYHQNADDASSALYTGEALMNMGQKEQAKRFIKQAFTQKPTVRACQAMYQIDANQAWIEQLAKAPHDKIWVCNKTGEIYNEWSIHGKFGHFNCLTWDYPESVIVTPVVNSSVSLLTA